MRRGKKGPSGHLALHVQRPCERRKLGMFGELKRVGVPRRGESDKERGRQWGWDGSKELTGWVTQGQQGAARYTKSKGKPWKASSTSLATQCTWNIINTQKTRSHVANTLTSCWYKCKLIQLLRRAISPHRPNLQMYIPPTQQFRSRNVFYRWTWPCLKWHLYQVLHCSVVYDSRRMETNQMSPNKRWLKKVWCLQALDSNESSEKRKKNTQ